MDIKLYEVAESLNKKVNETLKLWDIKMSVNVTQYKDHYAFEFFTADLKHSTVISINGKGIKENKYYPELFNFIIQIINF